MEGVKLLVEQGVDIGMVRVRGMMPVKMAVEYGHFDIASYLLAHGARVPEDQDFFVSCDTRGHAEGLRLAWDKVVSIDDENSEGSTAIFNAVAHVEAVLAVTDGNAEVAELLLCHGADPNMRTGPFSSVLSLAIAKGHVEVADVLLKHCAKEKCKEMDVDEEDYLAGMVELLSSA
ncbi:hypothetical protein GB937_008342 [Aspergillus fischeri]|nr:hypothetical protein GB937_008342 [Aspergillus fischeri]